MDHNIENPEIERPGLPPLDERVETFLQSMERDVWSKLPPEVRGRKMSREEEDELLGYGPDDVSWSSTVPP